MTATYLQSIMQRIQNRFHALAIRDPAELVEIDSFQGDQDHRARAIVETELATESPEIVARIREEYFGSGPLAAAIEAEDVTEIIVNGPGEVWLELSGRLERHHDTFLSELTFRNFLLRACRETGLQTSLDCPFVDGQWRDFRLHLITSPLTPTSSVLTLRRHPRNPWRLHELERRGWAPPEALACLRQLLERKLNFLIVGCTGSGKTSVLNACLQELGANERCILIEDTNELTVPNGSSTKLLTRKDANHLLRDVDQTELLRQSLRMRPDRIVMGEIRGPEAKDLLMAFATGHAGCIGTLHAETARQALLRLEMLIQLGAAQWNLHAVRTLILLSLNAIVVVKRDSEGQRRLEGIYQLTSLEDVGFLLEKLT